MPLVKLLKVEFDRFFVQGLYSGINTYNVPMTFVDWDDACRWAAAVTENVNCDYVVTELRNLETGEVEKF